MNYLGETFTFWRNSQDEANFLLLINKIQSKNCSAFIGAGISVDANYPSTKSLIKYLQKEAGVNDTELELMKDFTEKASFLKAELGNDFYPVLFNRFNPDIYPLKSDEQIYLDITEIPFKAFLTTNYDGCIQEASRLNTDSVNIYPILPVDNLSRKCINHIHGKIDLGNINDSSRTLVFTKEDYLRAYSKESSLPIFLESIFESHSILFLGFGMEEETLLKILEVSKNRKDFLRDFPITPIDTTYKFAILPINLSKTYQTDLSKEENEKLKQEYLHNINEQDFKLKNNYDVLIMRYFVSSSYPEIKRIISHLRKVTQVPIIDVSPKLDEKREVEI